MRINCPLCGERGAEEFVYHGDATVRRPAADAGEREWFEYVYLRDNPAGDHDELWYHASGCHSWLVVRRNLRSHTVSSATLATALAGVSPRDAA